MKRYIEIIILLTALLFAASVPAKNIQPDRLIDQTIQEILVAIGEDSLIQAGDHEAILNLIRSKVIPHFDFERMTRLAMGKNWHKAETEQQNKLVREFRNLLVRTYSNTLSRYRDEKIMVIPIKELGDKPEVTVKTKVIQGQGKPPVPINYRMKKTTDGWKAYDVIIAGVSLVMNYRGSFDSQISKGGIQGLIKTLADKNHSLEGK